MEKNILISSQRNLTLILIPPTISKQFFFLISCFFSSVHFYNNKQVHAYVYSYFHFFKISFIITWRSFTTCA